MKKIKDIIECDYDINISGITDDSRNVKKGYLFVATRGFNVDHYDYIDDAVERGCSFIVCDRDIDVDIPYMKVLDINNFFVEACMKFYDICLDDYHFIGITGTDGKTTTATLVKKIIGDAAYVGTNGLSVVNKTFPTKNTTPCVDELYANLKYIKDYCATTVMEVSSEALLHDRVKNFEFDIVAFTNVTGDHLNVHGSFDNYVKCKFKLLDLVKKNGYIVVNGDDEILQNITCQNMSTFGFDKNNDYQIFNVNYLSNFTEISVKYKEEIFEIKSPLKGKHNVYNIVMAFIIGLLFGIDKNVLIERIEKIGYVRGRCEELDFGQDYKIILDYAHTINGTKNILDTFSTCGKLITVVGCAGGREKSKRNIIGNLVMDKSDIAIFTMDDPRDENVSDIIDQMVGGRKDYLRFIDREEAINHALSIANKDDIVLILGKGRDNYMAINNEKVPYCDYEVVEKYFAN